jgi:recombination protein U
MSMRKFNSPYAFKKQPAVIKKGYANRGKAFEMLINQTNQDYMRKGWAEVHKSEPPVVAQQKTGNKITLGFYKKKGFVDYFGVYQGRAIAFEAKATKERTRFDLGNIDEDQMEILKRWHDQGGISFFLIEFTSLREIYFISYKQVEMFWIEAKEGGRKSIPYDFFIMHCLEVKSTRGVPVDYLNCVGQ